MPNFTYKFRTDKDLNFAGSLAQNAIAYEDVVVPGCLRGVNGNGRVRLRSIMLQSDQNLDWELWLFSGVAHANADMDLDTALGKWSFTAAMAVQIAGAGQYYYYIDGLDVSYVDEDNSGKFHIGLVNRSATSKNAGGTGEIVIQMTSEIEGP